MKNVSLGTVAAALMLAGASAQPQTAAPTYSMACNLSGVSARELVGDREEHAVASSSYSCRLSGGLLDGGVTTATQNWEWQGPSGTSLGGMGIVRHSKGMLVYVLIPNAKNNLRMENGKMVGFGGNGSGRFTLATGTAAGWANKTFSYTFRSTGFNQFAVDLTVD